VCTNQVGKSGRTTVVQTQGSGSVKDNIITVFGTKTATCLEPLDLVVSDGCRVEGFVSRPGAGCGRASSDRQFVYVNGRPVDLPKINKLLNELYGSFNSLQKPMAVLNFILAPTDYDVNVTPDKRKVFLHTESALLVALREALESVYTPEKYTYTVNNLADEPASTKQKAGSGGVLESGLGSSILQEDSDEEAPESPKGKLPARTEESEDFQTPKSGRSERRTSFEIRTASPSTSGQEKRAKSDFLNLLSFKLKGSKTGGSGKGIADALGKTSNVSRNSSKIMQSRLTNFVSTSEKSKATERYCMFTLKLNSFCSSYQDVSNHFTC
jgi:DNA mismatch repair protein PMS2